MMKFWQLERIQSGTRPAQKSQQQEEEENGWVLSIEKKVCEAARSKLNEVFGFLSL